MTDHLYDPKRILVLSKEISEKSVKKYIKKIAKFNAIDRLKEQNDPEHDSPILLVINSGGGNIYDGLALIGAIETSKTTIHTVSLGSCMSMAMFIFLAGHRKYMHRHSVIMYHEGTTWLEGDIGDIKNETKEMERVEKLLDEMFISKTKVTQKHIKMKMKEKGNWYITASEALKLKITDVIIPVNE